MKYRREDVIWGGSVEKTCWDRVGTEEIRKVGAEERRTPNYMILEETKSDELRVEIGRRAMTFEERNGIRKDKEMLY